MITLSSSIDDNRVLTLVSLFMLIVVIEIGKTRKWQRSENSKSNIDEDFAASIKVGF